MATTAKLNKEEREWRRTVSFSFGEGGVDPPDGFNDLSVEDEVTVVIRGKVSELNARSETQRLELIVSKVSLQAGKQKKTRTMGEMLDERQKARKV